MESEHSYDWHWWTNRSIIWFIASIKHRAQFHNNCHNSDIRLSRHSPVNVGSPYPRADLYRLCYRVIYRMVDNYGLQCLIDTSFPILSFSFVDSSLFAKKYMQFFLIRYKEVHDQDCENSCNYSCESSKNGQVWFSGRKFGKCTFNDYKTG